MPSNARTGALPVPDFTCIATPAGTFTARRVVVNYTYQFAFMGVIGAAFGGTYTTIPLTATSVMRTETQAAAP